MTLLLACTHLLAFLLGASVCRWAVVRYGRPLVEPQLSEDSVTQATTQDQPRRGASFRVGLVVLVASIVLIVIGGQAYLNQRADDDKDRKIAAQTAEIEAQAAKLQGVQGCLADWADDLTTTIQARSGTNVRLRNAQKRKDRADDRVTDVFVDAVLTQPPPPQDRLLLDITAALKGYVKQKEHLATVQGEVSETTAANPYPVLDLDCDPEADE